MMPVASDDQIEKATAVLKRVDLRDFSVCQFANPSLQSHYAVVQAMALDEDEMPEIHDETLPDEEGMSRPGIAKAMEEFKVSVYGENYDEEDENAGKGARKRKTEEVAVSKAAYYDWSKLADDGKLKDLTVQELKCYLTANKLAVAGKKEALITRILTHMVDGSTQVKQQVFAELEHYCPPHCILARSSPTVDLNLIGERTKSQ